MRQNKGFTLIEMLVVVGMIGVLAAAVLTALGPSRQKARDTRVISGLNQLAAIAETGFTGASYPANLEVLKLLPGGRVAIDDVKAITGSDPSYSLGGTNSDRFAIYSILPGRGSYCIDSNGMRRQFLTTMSVPSGDCSLALPN